jgi:hypothetical protein
MAVFLLGLHMMEVFFFDLAKRFFIAKWERERGTRA